MPYCRCLPVSLLSMGISELRLAWQVIKSLQQSRSVVLS